MTQKTKADAKGVPGSSASAGPVAAEAAPYQKKEGPAPADFTVARIEAATMITLACNTVADMLNTDEGTQSRNVSIRACDKTFRDMERAEEKCRKEGADDAADALAKGIAAYREYIAKHEAAESASPADKGKLKAEATAATEHLAAVMNEILHAF